MKRTPLTRKTRMRPVNTERAARRRAEAFGDLAEVARTMPCAACNAAAPSDPAHIRSRGAGGKGWTSDGRSNIIPLCRMCHTIQHSHGWPEIMTAGEISIAASAVVDAYNAGDSGCDF